MSYKGVPDPMPEPGLPSSPQTKGRGTKALAAAALLIVLVVFVVANSERVKLNFIVWSGHPRLIWLIVGCVLLGGAVGYFLGHPSTRRTRNKERRDSR